MYEEVVSRKDLVSIGSDENGIYPSVVEFGGRSTFSKSFECFYNEFIEYFCQYVKTCSRCNHFEINDEFENNRKSGHNHWKICELIRNDAIVDFIKYINEEGIDVNGEIKPSQFESIPLPYNFYTLIDYAALYGSIQIFMYLYQNKAKISDFIWIFAIHGQSAEIIQFLIDNKIKPMSYV